jgi:prepilin-type processing-associated H-X9-DG protein
MNFALYGKYLGEIDPEGTKSSRIVVTVETRTNLGLAQTTDDVDVDRHNNTPVAGYLDGHADKYGGTLGW